MGINFPNNPLQGALYTPPGGYQYVYLDGVWRVVEAPQSVGTAQTRNRIVNGAMQVSQEAGNSAVGTGAYPADQWTYSTTIAGAGQRVAGPTPNGSVYTLRMNQTTAKPSLAGTDFVGLSQFIEGIRVADFQWGTASAKQLVLRFTFYSNKAGTFSIGILNSANNRSYVDTFTISAGEANSYQTRTFVIPGDVTGTWLKDTGIGLQLWILAVCGSTYVTATKGWQAGAFYAHSSITNNLATAGDFYLGDVGLYLDPNATGTPPPWQMPDEAQELAACMRYYAYYFTYMIVGYNAAGGGASSYGGFQFHTRMRVIPSVTFPDANNSNVTATMVAGQVDVDGMRVTALSTAAGLFYSIANIKVNARM